MTPGRHPTVRRNPPVNRSTNQNNVDINSGIDTQMLDQLFAIRVVESLAAAAVTHAASTQEETNLGSNSSQNKACNYKEFRAVMHENFRGTEGAVVLTRWFEKLESQFGIRNVVEGDRVKFASSRGGTCMFVLLLSIPLMQHLGVISKLCSSESTALTMKSNKWKTNYGI
ncbi:hypothetical protein Tco_0219805 [Tanacetum coccineum]